MVYNLYLKFKIELHKMLYKCEFCGYSTNRLLNFHRHQKRKTPCKRRFNVNFDNLEVPENINAVPENINAVPENINVVPENINVVPENINVVPENINVVPENINVVPETNKSRLFTCFKCKKQFTRKDNLKLHESRCDGLDSRQCKICLKMFSTTQGKHQHNKYVKCTPPIQVQSVPHTVNNINNIDNSTTNNNTQNNTQNNYNVQLALNFGNEDLSGLINDPNYMKNVENQIQSFISQLPYLNEDAGKIIIGEIMKKIYFNKKYPQNQTIKKTCKKDNTVKVYQDNQWKLQMIEDVFKRVTHKVEEYLSPYFETLNDKYESLQQEDLTQEDRVIITNSRGFGNKVVWFNWDDILQPIIKINEVIKKTLQLPDIDDEDFSNEEDLKLQNKILKNTVKYLSQQLYENTKQTHNTGSVVK